MDAPDDRRMRRGGPPGPPGPPGAPAPRPVAGVPPRRRLTRRRSMEAAVAVAAVAPVPFTGCGVPAREFVAQSRVRQAEDVLSAYENWYATLCRQCGAGCGVIARVIEGRVKKLEGNPDHPLNAGKLCARGQAAVQEQYHPDRLTGPRRRVGERGAGSYSPTTWQEALGDVAGRLRDLRQQGRSDRVAVITPPLGAHRALIVDRFTRAYGAQWLTFDPLAEAPLREAARRLFQQERLPRFDLQHARYVVSFGADFLTNWLSPVRHGIEYGIFRQGSYRAGSFAPRGARPRGYLVQIEPRFSGTAANADEWVPVTPGAEGLLALAMSQVILSEGLADPAGALAFGDPRALDPYRPERVAADTGVTAERIRELARAFATRRPSLAIGGGPAGAHTSGTSALVAILALNLLVGGAGAAGGLLFEPPPPIADLPFATPASPLGAWQELSGRLRTGAVEAVLVYGADPVHGLPGALGFRDALLRAPFIASFSSFRDDTTALADLLLPAHLPLEDWGDDLPEPGAGGQVLTVQQPVVQPSYDTRGFWDVLLALAADLGPPVADALPWATMKDAVRDGARALQRLGRGSVQHASFERFWTTLLQRGGWWDDTPFGALSGTPGAAPGAAAAAAPAGAQDAPVGPAAPAAAGATGQPRQPDAAALAAGAAGAIRRAVAELRPARFAAAPAAGGSAGGGEEYYLSPFPHHTLGAGDGAHLPWLQALPDPVTSAVWQTWVEVNPGVARRLGLGEGDVVRLESAHGEIEALVYVSPAAPPNLLAVPLGQGHETYGRWAEGRGANPMQLLAPLVDEATGALAYGATRVRLRKTGRRAAFPKFEGSVPAYQLPGARVLKVIRSA